MVYEAAVANGQLTALEPVSRNAEVFTNAAGVAHANVTIPARTTGSSVGWALLSVGGLTGTDVSTTVGQFMPYGARVPTLLGDGFAAAGKPVGQTVEMQLVGAVPGTGFAVDYADEAGNWKEITADGGTTATSPDQISTVHYTVPRGLLIKAYKFRLRNISDSATSPLWLAKRNAESSLLPRAARPPCGLDCRRCGSSGSPVAMRTNPSGGMNCNRHGRSCRKYGRC